MNRLSPKPTDFITLALILAVSASALDIPGLADNLWTEALTKDQSFNLNNWTYENDAVADPVNGYQSLLRHVPQQFVQQHGRSAFHGRKGLRGHQNAMWRVVHRSAPRDRL